MHPITATYSGPPRYLAGGFAPNVISHAPSMNPNLPRASTAPSTQAETIAPRGVPAESAHNDWTDPSSSSRAQIASRTGNGTRSENAFTGTVLYPQYPTDVLGDRFGSGNGNSAYGGKYSNRLLHRYYNGYGYPYPYLFSGGYAPYFDGDPSAYTAPSNDYAGATANSDVASTDQPSPAAMNDLSRPYPNNSYLLTTQGDSTSAQDANAAAAAPQGPASASVHANSGPDSLVEAVQAELSRRGYFGGKIDAIYNDATHAAIQRFQNDQHLPASGRLNEATLHALQLD